MSKEDQSIGNLIKRNVIECLEKSHAPRPFYEITYHKIVISGLKLREIGPQKIVLELVDEKHGLVDGLVVEEGQGRKRFVCFNLNQYWLRLLERHHFLRQHLNQMIEKPAFIVDSEYITITKIEHVAS